MRRWLRRSRRCWRPAISSEPSRRRSTSALASSFYNAKQYGQARGGVPAGDRRSIPNDPEAARLLAEARIAAGQQADAVGRASRRRSQARLAAGQKPRRGTGTSARSRSPMTRKSPVAVDLGRQWVAAYPTPTAGRDAIAIYRNLNHPDVEGTLDLLRLMQATGALTRRRRLCSFTPMRPPSRAISTRRRRCSTRASRPSD